MAFLLIFRYMDIAENILADTDTNTYVHIVRTSSWSVPSVTAQIPKRRTMVTH